MARTLGALAVIVALADVASALVAPMAPVATHSRAVARSPATTSAISMKIFDWKRRSETYEEESDLHLHNLRPAPGSKHRKIRKGRGMGSGKGGPCGFGMRGQRSRSGRSVRPGFEGGQTPLYRRIPKLRGKPTGPGHTKTEYGLIKIDYLNRMDDNAEVTLEGLMAAGAMTKVKQDLVKVVGGTEPLSKQGLVVKAHKFTASARQAIEANGGQCVEIPPYPVKAEATSD